MNRRLILRTLTGAFVAATLLAAPAHAQSSAPGLDGDWVGTLENITGPGIAPPPNGPAPMLRLSIDRQNVRIFMDDREVKPGTFEIRREAANAVIHSIQSDPGARVGASWVETWTFVVTLADPDTLIVNYVRVVNNNHIEPSEDGARFSQIRTGQLRRAPRDV
jgi:hypothetical protein